MGSHFKLCSVIQNKAHATILQETESLLAKLFVEVNMPPSHGLQHCKTVLNHMIAAIKSSEAEASGDKLSDLRKLSLCLAAILHEADDHKYFGAESRNAANILQETTQHIPKGTEVSNEVLEMISYVSASVNGNSVPEKAKTDPSLLWPRFCDRLEAIGVIGAVRCYQYNSETGAPLSTETTPRPTSNEQVWTFVTEDRWKNYQNGGSSASMMDHYYDKLLQIAVYQPTVVQNTYLVDEASKRVTPLLEICVKFGLTGTVPEDLIKSYIS